ncbi:MAG: NAD-dependent epimerase/dehydratase family protein [Bacteriovoracaceae bacterium]
MNIMITGSSGFIGRHLVRRLSKGHSLFTPDREFFSSASDHQLQATLVEKKIEVVIHLASYFVRFHTVEDIAPMRESNVVLGSRILKAMEGVPSAWFINTGSAYENSGPHHDQPWNLYAETKTEFQNILSLSKVPHVTLKLFETYGPGDTRDKVLSIIHKNAVKKLPMEMSPGKQRLEMTYIDDVVSSYVRTLELLSGGKINKGIFGVPGERVSLHGLVEKYELATGNKTDIRWGALPYRPNEIMEPWSDFRTLPGFSPRVSLEEGIRKTFAADS